MLPYIDMNQPRVYMCSPSWNPLPPPSPSHPSGLSQYTSPEHPVSCIKPGLAIHFTYDNIHVLVPFSQIIPLQGPEHPVSCIEPGLAVHFTYDNIHVSMPFSQIIPPSPSPTESIRLFYTSVSLLLSRIQGCRYHLSKFHIYALVYCIDIFLSGLLHSV